MKFCMNIYCKHSSKVTYAILCISRQIINMEPVRGFEVIYDKFNIGIICA